MYRVGTCPGSSPMFMNFLYDTRENKVLVAWQYKSKQEQLQKFRELRDIPNRPPHIEIRLGNPENL